MALKREAGNRKKPIINHNRQNRNYISSNYSPRNPSSNRNLNPYNPIPFLNLPFMLTIIFLIFLGILLYYLYLNLPSNPENLFLGLKNLPELENYSSNNFSQFYPNMKFNHNSISYSIDSLCDTKKKDRVLESFDMLSDEIGLIEFYEVSADSDIEVLCSEYSKQIPEGDYFIAGEGGAKEIIQTGRYHIINQGVILLYEDANNFYECDWPNIELHELIHVFGFDHTSKENSLMYPLLTSCSQKLDKEIIEELKRLYSEENLADLYFENAEVVKKGIYLDFNLTVKNSGAVNSENVILSVLDEDKLIKEFNLDNLKYGAGIRIEIHNLKLIHKKPDEIQFIIDKKNFIKEIDEENNVLKSNI